MSSSSPHSERATPEPGVPRETLLALFPERVDATRHYAGILATTAVDRGIVGPREADRIWERHLLNCAVVAPAFTAGSTVADIGSGAGLPGLALALARPDLQVTLVESLLRRTTFLEETVQELELPNVVVVRARAEELPGDTYDHVTSRAVAPLDRLARWSLPLCVPGGSMVALKGDAAESEIDAARSVIHKWGGGTPTIHEYGATLVPEPTRAVIIVRDPTAR